MASANKGQLFPRIPYSRTRRIRTAAVVDRESHNAPYTKRELTSLSRALTHHMSVVECPRCGAHCRTLGPRLQHDAELWAVVCSSCRRRAVVRRGRAPEPPPPAFETLVVSRPKSVRPKGVVTGWTWSIAVHAAVGLAMVMVTTGVVTNESSTSIATDTTLVYLVAEPDVPPEAASPGGPVYVNVEAPPKGFLTIGVQLEMPVDVPDVDLTRRFDPRDYSGDGLTNGVSSGVVGGTGQVDMTRTYNETTVDEVPRYLSGPRLEYPRALKSAGIEGYVVVEFVVDTTGRAETESVNVLHATHNGFIEPARRAVRGSRYHPGRVRAVKVRVLVRQRLEFEVAP